ncbi:MAG: hypothetical protein AB2693_31415 [Candidatus Thiodiazotropha sp.]
MSAFREEIEALEITIKQINLEKSNLIEHLKKQDKNFMDTVHDLQSVFTSKIENLQLEIEKLKFALTKVEGEEDPVVFKVE